MSSPRQNKSSRFGSPHRAMLVFDLLDDRGIMNFDQNSPGVGKAGPAPFPDRPSSNSLSVRIGLGSRTGKRDITPFVLDFVERGVVLILFLYFAHKMLPRLTQLIVTEF